MDNTGSSPTLIQPGQPDDPLLGKVLANEFRLKRLLGKGGMGAVYLGEQISLQRPVAVKLLPFAATAETESRQRFQREAVVAARLQHPNIVQVYFFGQHEGQNFIAMEYVEGESLYAFMKRKGKLTLDESLKIGREVARGLGAAHKQGLVHRDVKPENVFISREGRVKLGDFGLARDLRGDGRLSVTGQVMGTPFYMPPEQCRGQQVDGRADIYALGATMYHMIAGHPPYRGDSAFDILNQHVSAPVPSADSFGANVPPPIADLVRRMMAKAPAERPATGEEVVAAIDRYFAARPPGSKAGGRPASSSALRAVPGATPSAPTTSAPTATAMRGPSIATQPTLRPSAPLDPLERKARWFTIAGCVAIVAIAGGVWWHSRSSASPAPPPAGVPPPPPPPVATAKPQPPPVVTPPTPHPTDGESGDPKGIEIARAHLEKGQFAVAIKDIERMPPYAMHGPFAEKIKSLREQALKGLLERIAPRLKEFADLLAQKDLAKAKGVLDDLDRIGVPEVDTKVKELRAQLAAAEAEKPHLPPDQAWEKLAADAWKLATQRKWEAALKSIDDQKRDSSLSSLTDRVTQLEGLMDGARKVDEEVVKALKAQKGRPFAIPGEASPEMSGTLSEVSDSGDLKVEPKEDRGLKVEVPFSKLPVPELMEMVKAFLAQDAIHHAAGLVWALALGETHVVDEFLLKDPSAAPVATLMQPPSVGWKCPWAKEEVEKRFHERDAADKAYAELASKAWKEATQQEWEVGYKLCKKALTEPQYQPVLGRVACLAKLMEMGKDTRDALIARLKEHEKGPFHTVRKNGDTVKGRLEEVSSKGDCKVLTVVRERPKMVTEVITVRFDDFPTPGLLSFVGLWMKDQEYPLVHEAVFAMARGDFEVGDARLTKIGEAWSNKTFFDITSEGWDASPWSAAAREKRARAHK